VATHRATLVFLFNNSFNGTLNYEYSGFVAIVNQTVAQGYWPGKNPIGKHIANSRDAIQREVVGVVSDVKFNALNIGNSEEMYLPLEQVPWPATTLIVHSQGDPQALVSGVRAKIAEIDSNLPVTSIASWNSIVAASVAQPRVLSHFVGVFADSRCCSPPSASTA